MNRRSFHSDSVAHAAGHLLAPWIVSPPLESTDIPLVRCSRRAMATAFELLLPIDIAGAASHAHRVFDLIDDIEAQLTVYHDDSELSRLNRRANDTDVIVDDRLFSLLRLAARVNSTTWGAFDVTSGPLIRAWGFFRREGRVPSPAERHRAMRSVGMKHVELDEERRSVRFRQPGMEINLGSIGKGYALDQAAELLRGCRIHSALIHGGGSSVRVLGCQPGDVRGWPVGIRHPWEESQRIGVVYLRDRAMGTSAATHQHFEYKGQKFGHLLDPRSGRPAEGIASATALAPTAAEADALATAFYVLGIEKTHLYCAAHPEVGAVLLPDGDAPPVVFNLTADDVSLTPATVS